MNKLQKEIIKKIKKNDHQYAYEVAHAVGITTVALRREIHCLRKKYPIVCKAGGGYEITKDIPKILKTSINLRNHGLSEIEAADFLYSIAVAMRRRKLNVKNI